MLLLWMTILFSTSILNPKLYISNKWMSSRNAVTLSHFLNNSVGEKVVIELKNESAVEGIIHSSDSSMNLKLEKAKLYQRRQKTDSGEVAIPLKLDTFFIRGKHIRFVHFETYENVAKILNRTYRDIPADERKNR